MRKGFLKPMMALLAGTGLAVVQPALATAGPPVARVSFEDIDKKTTSDGEILSKPNPMPSSPVSPASPVIVSGPMAEDLTSFPEGEVPYHGDMAPVEGLGDEGGDCCSHKGRFWFGAEYLLWWLKGSQVPPLVTTSTNPVGAGVIPGTTNSGILGQPGTVVLIGNQDLNGGSRSGGRFTAGMWLNDCHSCGIEGEYFFLGQRTGGTSVSSDGTTILARPFVLPNGTPVVEFNALPGALSATKTVTAPTFFQGAGIDGLHTLCSSCNYRVDLIGGFRYLNLSEGLNITENINVQPGIDTLLASIPANQRGPFVAGNNILVSDSFHTRNNFYGGDMGLKGEYHWGNFFVQGRGKVALGVTNEVVDINGSTFVTTPAGVTSELKAPAPGGSGGLLALAGTNAGHYSRNRFAVVPEAGFNLGYQFNDHVRAYVGYTMIYWSRVARPANQINTTINPNYVPTNVPVASGGPAQPSFTFHDSSFWAQGIDFGIELSY